MALTKPIKRLIKAGAKKGTTWGTAVTLTSTDGLLLLSDGLKTTAREFFYPKEIGQILPRTQIAGIEDPPEFSPSAILHYDFGAALGLLFAALFGSDTVSGSQAPYTHKLVWQNDIIGKFLTFATQRPNSSVWEVPSAKVVGLTISNDGPGVKVEFKLKPNQVKFSNTTNTNTQLDALTVPDFSRPIRFYASEAAIYINDMSGTTVIDPANKIYPSSLSITYERSIGGHKVFGKDYIIEPIDIESNTAVKLTIPAADSKIALVEKSQSGTPQKMAIVFTGPELGSGNYALKLYFPCLYLDPITDVPDDDIIPINISLKGGQAVSNPSGMTETVPYIEALNNESAAYI